MHIVRVVFGGHFFVEIVLGGTIALRICFDLLHQLTDLFLFVFIVKRGCASLHIMYRLLPWVSHLPHKGLHGTFLECSRF